MDVSARGENRLAGQSMLERAFSLLAVFGPTDRSLSLTSMSARSGLPKSSALRIARQLTDCGALERLGDGDFVIGLRLLEIASLAPRGHRLRETALPYMEDLHLATGQHVLLAVRDGAEAVLVERLSALGAASVLYRVGGRMPLHATAVGLCLLAGAPPEVQGRALAGRNLTVRQEAVCEEEHGASSGTRLRATLAAVRRDGVAVFSRSDPTPVTSVAAPILGRGGEVIAALSVVTPTVDARPAAALRPAVIAACRAISRAMRRAEPHSSH